MRLDDRWLAEVEKELQAAETTEAVEAIRLALLGRKGRLTEALRGLRERPPEERRHEGERLNRLKERIEALIRQRLALLASAELERQLARETIDLTLPGIEWPAGHRHPLGLMQERLEDIFVSMGYEVVSGPEVEDDYHNFAALNFPPNHPAREMHDTFFLPCGWLLRTHTSPVQIRIMQARAPEPLRIIAPGRVYRRDDDPTHSPVFYQVEGLVVGQGVTMAELKGTLLHFAAALFGSRVPVRLRPSYFPFTEPSAEMDVGCVFCGGSGCRVCKESGWLELGGAGMVHPNVLRNGGYDPEQVTGFAFGCGVDRMAMLFYGIDDVRLLYGGDVRFLEAF